MTSRKLVIGAGAARFNWLPVFVALRLGLFERGGLEIDIKRLGTVDKATSAVRSGDIDVAITPPEGAIKDVIDGGNLRIVAGNTNSLPLTLVAHSRFRTIESLKGARLGTSSLTEGTALYTMEMLRRHGLHYPGDYEFVVVGVHPARWKALQEGAIDAAVQPAPLNFVAIEAGYSNLGEVTDYIAEIAFTVVIVDATRLASMRTKLLVFLRALRDAAAVIYSGTQDPLLVSILEEMGEADATYGQRTLDYMREKRVFPSDLSIPDGAFSKSVELMQKAGLIDTQHATHARKVLDLSLIAEL